MVDGNPVAWFQGRMEFGPRALGGRSIIGCPSATGVADRINHQIKFRERWRPFCPSMLDTVAPQMIKVDHPAPFMTFTFEVSEEWKTRVPEVVHEDGTSRAQVLKREYNPRYYDMMKELEVLTGNGVSLNTSLNRRGEAMICSPKDALDMFFGSDLQYLIMEDILVVKDNNGLEGKRINGVAKHNGSLFITWKPEMGWYAETGLTLVGQRYADNQNTVILPGYGRWDALAGYREKDWDVSGALTNLTDRYYYASATSAAQIMPGEPRSLVMTGTYKF